MILGELGMEFLDLEDSRFSFADTGNAKESHINPEVCCFVYSMHSYSCGSTRI